MRGGAGCVLLVMCGLPGAGKSTLTQRVSRWSARAADLSSATSVPGGLWAEVRHISFDDVYFRSDAADAAFEADRWRQSRAHALLEVERHIDESLHRQAEEGTTLRVIVVDDNMYYRSMRHQCYLLAKKYEVPYGQVYVKASLSLALARNAQRTGPTRVPAEVIERMHARFEEPQPEGHRWERHTYVVQQKDSSPGSPGEEYNDDDYDQDLQQLWRYIMATWHDNSVKAEADEERERERRRRGDREQCLTSLLHRLDQQLRSVVASVLADRVSGAKEAGKLVACLKRAFLAEARERDDVRAFIARPRAAAPDDAAPPTDEGEMQLLLQQLGSVFRERCLAALTPPP